MTLGINGLPKTNTTPSSVTDTDYGNFARTLGVEKDQLKGAVQEQEKKAAGLIKELANDADGYTDADKHRVESEMMDGIASSLGLSDLSNEQMMALMELCKKCLADVEKEVLGANGVKSDKPQMTGTNDNSTTNRNFAPAPRRNSGVDSLGDISNFSLKQLFGDYDAQSLEEETQSPVKAGANR